MALRYPREILAEFRGGGGLDFETMSTIVDTVYFAGQIMEEGEPTRVAVVHDPNGAIGLAEVLDTSWEYDEHPRAWDVLKIARQPFDPTTLAKLARGVTYGSQLIVVGGGGSNLWVDGIARRGRGTDGGASVRVASPRPGTLVLERGIAEILRIEGGDRAPTTVDVLGLNGPVRHAIGTITGDDGGRLEEDDDPRSGYSYTEMTLLRVLRKMRLTQSGAILAIVPAAPESAAIAPMLGSALYRPHDSAFLSRRIAEDKDKGLRHISRVIATFERDATWAQRRGIENARSEAQSAAAARDDAIDDLAHLSAIDGAVIAGPGLAVYAAGCMITGFPKSGPVVRARDARMRRTEPYSRPHGARHNAAFSLAAGLLGTVAFVISEDGPVTCALSVGGQTTVWPVQLLET